MKKALLIVGVIALIIAGCKSKESFQSGNVAYLYNPQDLNVKSYLSVEHLNDTVSKINYRFNSGDLLYVRDNEEGDYQSSFNITYSIMPSFESTLVLDSGSYTYTDMVSKPVDQMISGSFKVKTPAKAGSNNKDYLLLVEFTDLLRNKTFYNYQALNKSSKNNPEYWVLQDTAGNNIFKPHIPPGVPFRLEHSTDKPQHYYVSVYTREFPLALPPYSSRKQTTFELEPDSIYRVAADEPIVLPARGFYHFRLDTSQWLGYTVYSFYKEYPYVATVDHMGMPLRYLTTSNEFDGYLDVASDREKLKKYIDRFWLNRAGSIERSQKLIGAYYGRIEQANKLFTSYVEGWKTDRGIIYTVYGPPNKVFANATGESWVYGNENSTLSYIFNFIKVENPFSNNDYELERSQQYRYGWGQAIEAWRNGHIYNSRDIKREQDAADQAQLQRGPYGRYSAPY